MRIAFLDASHLKFCAATPFERPLGGSQSALCYLSAELARLGHAVTIFNGCRTASDSDGIQIRNFSDFQVPGVLNTFDFAVVLNSAVGHICRRDLSAKNSTDTVGLSTRTTSLRCANCITLRKERAGRE